MRKKIIVIIFILLFFGETITAIKIDDLHVTSIREVPNKKSGIADLKPGDIVFQFSQYIALHNF